MTAVWEAGGITSTQKLVLLALADWANDEGLCWPSIARLAKKSALGERTVQTTIKSLVEAGYVIRETVTGKGNRYWIRMDNAVNCTTAKSAPPQNTALTPAKSAPNTLEIRQHYIDEAFWLPKDAWQDWLAMRKKMKKPLTDRAMTRAIKKLTELRAQGHDPEKVLDQSVTNCWIDLYPLKETTNGSTNYNHSARSVKSADGLGDALNRRLGLG